ncbi:hypothetical protein PVAP13_8NG243501 [Panicum virgatum]|uniref:Uncharacterized protein n=1 Tax=Panicum virgatum TaxID=38727 RepID=A0A8T0P9B5_PANVG|nr:hypothetical protein PVAP13_8NG243501 [Panicum virgatum]
MPVDAAANVAPSTRRTDLGAACPGQRADAGSRKPDLGSRRWAHGREGVEEARSRKPSLGTWSRALGRRWIWGRPAGVQRPLPDLGPSGLERRRRGLGREREGEEEAAGRCWAGPEAERPLLGEAAWGRRRATLGRGGWGAKPSSPAGFGGYDPFPRPQGCAGRRCRAGASDSANAAAVDPASEDEEATTTNKEKQWVFSRCLHLLSRRCLHILRRYKASPAWKMKVSDWQSCWKQGSAPRHFQ